MKVEEDITDPDDVTEATKVLIEAVGLGDSESLPATATIAELAEMLEHIASDTPQMDHRSCVERLLETVKAAVNESSVAIEVQLTAESIKGKNFATAGSAD